MTYVTYVTHVKCETCITCITCVTCATYVTYCTYVTCIACTTFLTFLTCITCIKYITYIAYITYITYHILHLLHYMLSLCCSCCCTRLCLLAHKGSRPCWSKMLHIYTLAQLMCERALVLNNIYIYIYIKIYMHRLVDFWKFTSWLHKIGATWGWFPLQNIIYSDGVVMSLWCRYKLSGDVCM
jgi:hypothetical protein